MDEEAPPFTDDAYPFDLSCAKGAAFFAFFVVTLFHFS
jgi:hypothetical protein